MDAPLEHLAEEIARLQRRVNELTAALAAANGELQRERADRARTEEALRARERFRAIVEDLPVMVTLTTPDGEFAEGGTRHPYSERQEGRTVGGGSRSSLATMLTSAGSESAFILRITWPRCAFTVISVIPSSPPTCLFKRPETTSTMTSRSRGVSDA
jgi:hypothetical protein